jgi:hypothetical protein
LSTLIRCRDPEIRPIDGGIWQVSTPALVVGGVWAPAGERNAATIAIGSSAMRRLNMTKLPAFWNCSLAALMMDSPDARPFFNPRNMACRRLPTRLTGPPRFIGVPRRTPTPGAPTPGITKARATGRGRNTTPGLTTHPTGYATYWQYTTALACSVLATTKPVISSADSAIGFAYVANTIAARKQFSRLLAQGTIWHLKTPTKSRSIPLPCPECMH